ncbi:Bug family tripartite tricarboxylate transporter substrate binding protein [Alkalilacustris brevis]|uniref:Bug family tripartite tricarboxylate transporter substrate binding protein n=1 Tax=Alkalilacustris brevis TaxID=2026338 RepID=UPI000E0DE360|nr:tripartite tricarboxylate transporter substrate-binding protein [Alkalilacustris brevis]
MTKKTHRNGAIATAVAGVVALAAPAAVSAQDYPTQPIQATVAFGAGGFADTIGRIFAQGLSDRLGQPIVVQNQGGAGGNVGATRVANEPADGYHMLITTSSIALSQAIYANLEYDLHEDLTVIAAPVTSPEVLAVHPSVPANDLNEFIEWARTVDEVTYGSAGVGSTTHLVSTYFLDHLGGLDNIVHVPYSGGGPANQAAIGGEIDMIGSSNAVYPFIREGLLKGLGIASAEEHDAVPGVRTFRDQGFDLEAAAWVALFMPAGVDDAVIERINTEVNAMLDDPDVQQRLRDAGVQMHSRNVEETRAFVLSEIDNWQNMVDVVGVEVQ